MAEPIDDGPLASVREYAAVEQPYLTLLRGVVLGLLSRLDAAEAERGALRAGYRALLENVVRVVEEQQSGPDPDPESARVLRRLRGELEGLRE